MCVCVNTLTTIKTHHIAVRFLFLSYCSDAASSWADADVDDAGGTGVVTSRLSPLSK